MFISALTTLNLGMTEERSKRASLLPVNITLDHEGEASFYHSLFHVLFSSIYILQISSDSIDLARTSRVSRVTSVRMWTGREDWSKSFLHWERKFGGTNLSFMRLNSPNTELLWYMIGVWHSYYLKENRRKRGTGRNHPKFLQQ